LASTLEKSEVKPPEVFTVLRWVTFLAVAPMMGDPVIVEAFK
jgi:hypothetical protein